MTDLLAVVLLGPEDSMAPEGRPECRVLGGARLADRAVHLLAEVFGGCQVIMAALDLSVAALVDPAEIQVVLLLDPTYPFVPADQLRAVVAAVDPDGSEVAALAVTGVTDTLKQVDVAGRVLATEDRHAHVAPVGALAVTPAVLGAALSTIRPPVAAPVEPVEPVELVELAGVLDRVVGIHRVMMAGSGHAACRVTDQDSLDYAEAVLAASSRSATTTSPG